MKRDSRNRLTICIPTLNRGSLLEAMLAHYRSSGLQCDILIGDGSSIGGVYKNSPTGRFELSYFHTPHLSQSETFEWLASHVRTPYATYHGDDDFLHAEGVEACLDELDRNPAIVGCHGTGVARRLLGHKTIAEYVLPKYEAGGSLDRVLNAFSDYRVNVFSIHRTNVWQQMWEGCGKVPDKAIGAEIMPCLASAALGRTIQLKIPYLVRQIHEGIYPLEGGKAWMDTQQFEASVPMLIRRIANLVKEIDPRMSLLDITQKVSLGFMEYLGKHHAMGVA